MLSDVCHLHSSRAHKSCGRVAYRHALEQALCSLGIRSFFSCSISAEDGMETRSQQLLSACMKLGRPPNQCVAFVADPGGITAAHNASMRAVAVQGCHPGYKLHTADGVVQSLAELTVYNLRRLFANVGNEMMDLRKAVASNDDLTRRKAAVGCIGPD